MRAGHVVTLALVLLGGAFVLAEETVDPPRVLFIAEDDQGKVWANLSLLLRDSSGAYLPMVIGVQNKSDSEIRLNRESFWLADLDGVIYPMPSVRNWRKHSKRIVLDRRLMSTGGIPWEVWYSSRRFARSNFFPDLRPTRGNTTMDNVNLRTGFGMVDLMYFERLRQMELHRPFFLTIHPKGWERPIRLRLYLS
jgi:hypothetical protein